MSQPRIITLPLLVPAILVRKIVTSKTKKPVHYLLNLKSGRPAHLLNSPVGRCGPAAPTHSEFLNREWTRRNANEEGKIINRRLQIMDCGSKKKADSSNGPLGQRSLPKRSSFFIFFLLTFSVHSRFTLFPSMFNVGCSMFDVHPLFPNNE